VSAENDNDPVPRDAWLREALRHAPDADAAPPPKLSDTILRMGRAAVAPRAERSAGAAAPAPRASASTSSAGAWPDGLAALWARLARPPVAAGFAGLMVATVVGVTWWDRSPEDVQPPQDVPVAAAPEARQADGPALATAPPEASPPAPASTRVAAADARARKAAPTPPAAAAKGEGAPAAPPPAPAVAAAPTPSPAQNTVAAETARARDSAERREDTLAKSGDRAQGREAGAAAPGALAGRVAVPAAAAPTVPASAALETPGFSNLRFEIRRKPEAWTWTRDDGAARPVDAAVEAWIAQADRTARPVWQAGSSGSEQVSATLRFTRDGVVRAVLRIGPAGMRLTRGGKTESAELSRGQAAALLSGLDALGP
jgi:hypothetical protein